MLFRKNLNVNGEKAPVFLALLLTIDGGLLNDTFHPKNGVYPSQVIRNYSISS
jgi:hypothetical protein